MMKIPLLFASALISASALAAENPYVGNWALTLPGGAPGWLGVKQEGDHLAGSLLWAFGSVEPVDKVALNRDSLVVTRVRSVPRKDESGKVIGTDKFTDTITAVRTGDTLKLELEPGAEPGKEATRQTFTGKLLPPHPKAPDLKKVKFGAPVPLFNGRDLGGWRPVNPKAPNGWSVADGILINTVPETVPPRHNNANLRTEAEFTDFRLTLETRVPKAGNSGIYLRGVYEVQVADSFGKKPDPHNMGSLYSRITPSANAEKPAGEWQKLDITLVERHLTVILNGTTIIDNQPVPGVTGGALSPDELKPGPIFLQGDHTGVEYRDITLMPVEK